MLRYFQCGIYIDLSISLYTYLLFNSNIVGSLSNNTKHLEATEVMTWCYINKQI